MRCDALKPRKESSEMKVTEMTFSTSHGDMLVTAKQFASISDDDIKWLEITRDELVRCWKEGEELMKGHVPGDRVRQRSITMAQGLWLSSDTRAIACGLDHVAVGLGHWSNLVHGSMLRLARWDEMAR